MAPVYEPDAARAHSGQGKDRYHSNRKYAQERSRDGRSFERDGKREDRRHGGGRFNKSGNHERSLVFGGLGRWVPIQSLEGVARLKAELHDDEVDFNALYALDLPTLSKHLEAEGYVCEKAHAHVTALLQSYFEMRGKDTPITLSVSGVLEPLGNGDAVLVYLKDNYEIRALSAFVPACLIEHYQLKRGHVLTVRAMPPVEGSSCPVVVDIVDVMGEPPAQASLQKAFTDLETIYPQQRFMLEMGAPKEDVSLRVLDLLAPMGVGQRGLIAGPSRSGKTTLLHTVAKSIASGHPHAHLIVLLLDERPECIAELRAQVRAEVVSSSFGQGAESHVHAAEIVVHRARRLAEQGKDVVVLVDSMTRLVRAYNAVLPGNGRSRILPGGLDVAALNRPKRFFSAGRALRDGGSLTLLATLLTGTGSAMDESIYEVFKDASNQVIHLDGMQARQQQYPSVDMELSGTYREELLYHPEELNEILTLRRSLLALSREERMPYLLRHLKKAHSNAELLSNMDR